MDLLLIRHAQSANNQLWDLTGASRGRSPDPEITELGRLQADAVARTLASGRYDIAPRHLYTSLMLRAVQTAAPIADALDLPLLGHRETFEVFGPVEYHPDDPDDMWPHPGSGREPLTAVSPRLVWPNPEVLVAPAAPVEEGGDGSGWWPGPVERMDQVPDRARRVITDLVETHGGTDDLVALVTHGTFTQYLLRELLGIPAMTGWISIANTSLCLFRSVASPDRPVLASWVNRFDHLETDLFSE